MRAIRAGDVALLVLRLGFGAVLAVTHGWGTFRTWLGPDGQAVNEFPDPLGLGPGLSMGLVGFAEFFCALAVAIGLAGRLAALPLVVNFAVAAFVFHAGDPFARRELAVHYFVAFAALALSGPGRLSVDGLWAAVKASRSVETPTR